MEVINPNILAWICSIISGIGCFLNIKKRKECFIIWSISNMGFIYINVVTKLYGQIIMWVIFTIINIYGYKKWSGEE